LIAITMTVEAWLAAAVADAEQRGLPELKPLLETLARSTNALRKADEHMRAAPAASLDNTPPTRSSDARHS
jgi:hypothetical protein